MTPPSAIQVSASLWRAQTLTPTARTLPEETPVALSYDRESFAVMMATPSDLHDFALGFSLSEGIIENPAEISDFELVTVDLGIECRMSLAPARRAALAARRRRIAGPLGCGLCGIDSLQEAVRPIKRVPTGPQVSAQAIASAMARMAEQQTLNQQTRAAHAAAFLNLADDSMLLREDVGRHNALDKLIGAAALSARNPAAGAVLLTSRVSIDLIQKTAMFGATILAAMSVPTARAVRVAQAAGITLIAIARDDGFEVFTYPERIAFVSQNHVA